MEHPPPEPPASPDPRRPPNAAIAWLRVAIWLSPTGIAMAIGMFLSMMGGPVDPAIGVVMVVLLTGLAGGFDSQLRRRRPTDPGQVALHVFLFLLAQVLIVPVLLFGIFLATCAFVVL